MHSQYKSVSQNDHQDETEEGDCEDDEEDSEDDEEDSKDDDSDDKILAVFGSDSEDEDSHEESGKDESDDMNVHQCPSSAFEEEAVLEMTTPSATSTKETTNYARICRLLVDFGTWALRNKFDSIHPPSTLSLVLATPKTRDDLRSLYTGKSGKPKVVNSSQLKKLYQTTAPGSAPIPTVSSSDFDTTLLSILLRNICNLKTPSTGWDDLPYSSDTSPEADIVRIKYYRNNAYAHAEKARIDDTTFLTIWNDIRDAIVRLGGNKTDIDALKTECMDPDAEKRYTELVKKMIKDDEELREKIKNLEDKFDEMGQEFHGLKERLDETFVTVSEMKKNQDDTSRDKGTMLESELPKVPGNVHGHTDELHRIVKLLTDDSNKDVEGVLVSGIPGVGKSTVSIQAGHILKDDFARIVKFCSLRDMHPTKNGRDTKDDEGERVLREILSKCQPGYQPAHEYPKHVLLNWCRGLKQDLVLVLDNAEDAMEVSFNNSLIQLLTEMRTCSKGKIKFIITSRRTDIESTGQVLNVEKVTVNPLSEEDSIQVLIGVGRLQGDSDVSGEDLSRVAKLCEYIPMALCLASPLLSSDSEYSVDELVDDLEKHPTRTLECEAIMEIAFEKLSEPLRHSLIRLSIFGRSFEKKAARALLGDNCIEHLMKLRKRCFIQKQGDRYFLHLLLRSYARTIGAEKFPDILNHGQQPFDEHFLAMISENAEMYMRKDKCKASFDLFNEERLNYESLLRDVSDEKIQNCKALQDAVSGCRKVAPYVEFCVPVKLNKDFLNGLLRYVQKENDTVHEVEILCFQHYEGRKQGCAKMYAKGLMDIASKLFEENRPAFEKSVPSEVIYRRHYGRYLSQDCGQIDEAQDYFRKALSICESYEKETSEDLPLAEENYMKAIDIMKRLGVAEHKEAIPTYNKMGICFERREMFKESRKTYEKGSEVADNTIEGNHKWKVWIKTNLALLLHSKYPGDVDVAFAIAKDVLEMGRQLGLKDKDWSEKEALEKVYQTN
ncbi:E3 ubiquitin-protein ligase DZIP3 [Stylophora pistillata]|uniref:E3 ubiquitin-protein ligase DZIP3 n=1 Tax=Stylophora pistillata TaxID=50429 RepID=A0A2B4RPR2_STYPI|nr:E3 ubiquitin-protein ligase DZIP3 [Stylophora pistillata]